MCFVQNGHCVVPQHYTRNRALGKWVAKQREQYRFYREGKHSFLTEERIDLLKSVGFVWKIKGRGMKKGQPTGSAKTAMPSLPGGMVGGDAEGKSLAKMEEEEAVTRALGAGDDGKLKSDSDTKMGDADISMSLPPMSQQQLLQANIAANASSNQTMVNDLAAALRLGGANPNDIAAAMRGQVGNDDGKTQPFTI